MPNYQYASEWLDFARKHLEIRTHNLMELHKECCKYLDLSTIDLDTLIEINDYYENERYPSPK